MSRTQSPSCTTAAPTRFCLWAILFYLVATPVSSQAADKQAQSSFRFKTKPEFMLLRVYPDAQIEGYAASLWQKGNISLVLGRILRKDTIELSFFPASIEEVEIEVGHGAGWATRLRSETLYRVIAVLLVFIAGILLFAHDTAAGCRRLRG